MAEIQGLWDQVVVIGLLVKALVFLHDQLEGAGIPPWGVTIIVFTILIRTITLPLTLQSLRSTRRMQQLQPKLAALQKQYKNDKEKLMAEQMALYKEYGVNPVGGCLPMLVQMPVWLALYGALSHLAHETTLYPEFAQPFLWIPNLGLPEFTWENFPHQLPILALLTGLTQWVTTRMAMQTSTDPNTQAMNQVMQFMPLMFIFFSLNVPAGLVLYWVTSNLYQMIQQYFITGWGGLVPQTATVTPSGPPPRAAEPTPVAPTDGRTATSTNTGRRRRNKRR